MMFAGWSRGARVTKTFTLSEAQMLLPVLEDLLLRARSAATQAAGLEAEMHELTQRIFLAGGMRVDVVAAARRRAERDKASQEMKDALGEIEAIGVRVQDFEAGLLDFPCLADGRMVLLCWKLGETAITHWHGEEDGVEGRRPVETLFGKPERPN